MTAYRTPGERPEEAAPLPKGPTEKCPACGAKPVGKIELCGIMGACHRETIGRDPKSPLPAPRACTPGARVSIGLFRRCKVEGQHLHEACKVCGLRWLSAFGGD